MIIRTTFIASLLISILSYAATYHSVTNGLWEVDATWDSNPTDNDCNSNAWDTYNVNHYVTSNCATMTFSGNVFIVIRSGGTLYLTGSGGVSGAADITVETGGTLIILGDLNINGLGALENDGTVQVHGDVNVGIVGWFDCNGSGSGSVQIGGAGCSECGSGGGSCQQNVPLPVNLASFTLDAVQHGVLISWITTYEENNAWFELERSEDGVNYSLVHKRQGMVNFEGQTEYSFLDTDTKSGITYYYRLSQIDLNGDQTRTEASSITYGDIEANLTINPNPTSQADLSITIQTQVHEDVLLVLYDVNGGTICSKVQYMSEYQQSISADDLQVALPSGIYFVVASNKNFLLKRKLIVY